ncbi:Ig domain-containing protein [Chloroflexus sp.]|uniref:Ig domain-containing protein n=1 Tax=Chloroflexus sp. TaxID=1904827 RepID=UPI002ACE27EA|nr:Ig domain-containing protein [Chloroflexus sp.]
MVQGKESGGHGGGVALVSTTGMVEASVIVGNRSTDFGGGVYAQGGQPDTGDVLTISAPTKPVWLTLTDHGNGTARLTGTPATPGAYEVVLRVIDNSGLSAEQRFTITVTRARWEVFVPMITK